MIKNFKIFEQLKFTKYFNVTLVHIYNLCKISHRSFIEILNFYSDFYSDVYIRRGYERLTNGKLSFTLCGAGCDIFDPNKPDLIISFNGKKLSIPFFQWGEYWLTNLPLKKQVFSKEDPYGEEDWDLNESSVIYQEKNSLRKILEDLYDVVEEFELPNDKLIVDNLNNIFKNKFTVFYGVPWEVRSIFSDRKIEGIVEKVSVLCIYNKNKIDFKVIFAMNSYNLNASALYNVNIDKEIKVGGNTRKFTKEDPYGEEDWGDLTENKKAEINFIPFELREKINPDFKWNKEIELLCYDHINIRHGIPEDDEFLKLIKKTLLNQLVSFSAFSYGDGLNRRYKGMVSNIKFNSRGVLIFELKSWKGGPNVNVIGSVDERKPIKSYSYKRVYNEEDPYGEEDWEINENLKINDWIYLSFDKYQEMKNFLIYLDEAGYKWAKYNFVGGKIDLENCEKGDEGPKSWSEVYFDNNKIMRISPSTKIISGTAAVNLKNINVIYINDFLRMNKDIDKNVEKFRLERERKMKQRLSFDPYGEENWEDDLTENKKFKKIKNIEVDPYGEEEWGWENFDEKDFIGKYLIFKIERFDAVDYYFGILSSSHGISMGTGAGGFTGINADLRLPIANGFKSYFKIIPLSDREIKRIQNDKVELKPYGLAWSNFRTKRGRKLGERFPFSKLEKESYFLDKNYMDNFLT